MDIKTAALAANMVKEHFKESGQVGYVEPSKVYTFDGNAKETQDYSGIIYAKIANSAPNLRTISKAIYTAPDGSTTEFSSEYMTITDVMHSDTVIGQIVTASTQGMNIQIMRLDGTGFWVYNQPGWGYISGVEFAETIHPIDQKYLPGVCLPMMELTTEPVLNVDAELTTAECTALNAIYEKKTPFVCQFQFMGITVSVLMLYVNGPATDNGYIAGSPVGNLYLTVTETGTWTARFEA